MLACCRLQACLDVLGRFGAYSGGGIDPSNSQPAAKDVAPTLAKDNYDSSDEEVRQQRRPLLALEADCSDIEEDEMEEPDDERDADFISS